LFLDTAAANFTPRATLGGLTKNMCIPTLAESALVAMALNGLLQRIKLRRENSLMVSHVRRIEPVKKAVSPRGEKAQSFLRARAQSKVTRSNLAVTLNHC
jgi:hypothetical protein